MENRIPIGFAAAQGSSVRESWRHARADDVDLVAWKRSAISRVH